MKVGGCVFVWVMQCMLMLMWIRSQQLLTTLPYYTANVANIKKPNLCASGLFKSGKRSAFVPPYCIVNEYKYISM